MRKLLRVGTALAVVLAAGLSYAESQWKQSGSMRYRTEQVDNADFVSKRTDTQNIQLKWDLTFQPNDMTTIFFQPKLSLVGGTTATHTTIAPFSDPALSAHQAYFNHKFADSFALLGGRSELVYGDQLVIGPVGWHVMGRSFDGLKGRYSMDNFWIDLFTMKVEESVDTTAGSPTLGHSTDIDFSGIYFSYTGLPFVSAIDLYYLMRADRQEVALSGGDMANVESMTATGLRLTGDTSGIDYRLEYTTESGKRATAGAAATADIEKASQYDVEVGYTLPGDFKARFALEAFSAGEGYDQLYPTAHKWLGYADLFGRRNISGFVLHAKVPVSDFTIGFDYHTFNRVNVEEDASVPGTSKYGAYKLNGSTSWGTTGTDAAIGSEMDLTVGYKFGPAFSGTLGYSSFTSGEYMKKQGFLKGDTALTLLYVEMSAKF